MQKLIDSISGIDLTAVQPEQLCRKHGTFRCNSTGSGRDKRIPTATAPVHPLVTLKTRYGKLPQKQW